MDFNFLRNRLQNIFGGPTPTFDSPFQMPPTPDMATPPMMPDDSYDAGARMRELYQPETTNIDKFNQLAGQYPAYQEPGKLKKIASIALGSVGDLFGPQGSGKAAFSGLMGYDKHNREVSDWKNKIDPLKDAATYERQSNNQNRQFATSTVAAEQKQQKDEAYTKNQAEKTEIARMRANVYDWKAKNPMAKIIAPKGGNIKAINPITGQTIMDFGPSGTMSDKERLELEQTNRMNLQNDAQAARVDLQDDQQEATAELEGTRQRNRIALKGTPSASQTGKGESSTQKRVGEFLRAREVANTNPALAQFIELGDPGSNDFRIKEPATKQWWGGMSHGPTPEQYQQLQQIIYGTPEIQKTNIPPPPPAKAGASKPAGASSSPAPASSGRASGAGPRGQGGAPSTKAEPLRKTQRNVKTGQTRTLISLDGGKTWSVEK